MEIPVFLEFSYDFSYGLLLWCLTHDPINSAPEARADSAALTACRAAPPFRRSLGVFRWKYGAFRRGILGDYEKSIKDYMGFLIGTNIEDYIYESIYGTFKGSNRG